MAQDIRAAHWPGPLGPTATWPAWLRIGVMAMLDSPLPTLLLVGPELLQIYNDAFRPLLEGRHPRALGQPTRDCWPQSWELDAPVYREVMAGGGRVRGRNRSYLLGPAGASRERHFTLSYLPLRDEAAAVRGVIVAAVEITRQVQQEEAHAAQLQHARLDVFQLRRLFEQAPGFMALLRGPQHRFEMANPAYMSLVGHRDLIGLTVREAFPDVSAPAVAEILDQVFRDGTAFVAEALKVEFRDAEGNPTERYLDFVYQPVLEPDGAVSGIFVQGHDATRQILAARALAEAGRNKDRFLALLAHELRNPIAPISSVAELLRQLGRNDPALARLSGILARQTAHMTRLIDDLLDASRVGRGELQLEVQDIDLADVVAAAIEQAGAQMERRGHALSWRVDDRPLPVRGDSARLVQALANLLHNAAKYTPTGGQVELTAGADADSVVVEVRDNGNGIPQDLLPHIFEPFAQAQQVPGRSDNGLGLGLALVRSLVQLHGGTVSACSPGVGQGSVFTVRLPCACQSPLARASCAS